MTYPFTGYNVYSVSIFFFVFCSSSRYLFRARTTKLFQPYVKPSHTVTWLISFVIFFFYQYSCKHLTDARKVTIYLLTGYIVLQHDVVDKVTHRNKKKDTKQKKKLVFDTYRKTYPEQNRTQYLYSKRWIISSF